MGVAESLTPKPTLLSVLLECCIVGKVLPLHLIIPIGQGHVGPLHIGPLPVVLLLILSNAVSLLPVVKVQQPAAQVAET